MSQKRKPESRHESRRGIAGATIPVDDGARAAADAGQRGKRESGSMPELPPQL